MATAQLSPPQSLAANANLKTERLQTTYSEVTSSSTLGSQTSTWDPIKAEGGYRPASAALPKVSKLKGTVWQLSICVLSLALFAVIVLFVQASKYAERDSTQKRQLAGILQTKASLTLAILRTAQAVLSTITTLGLNNALEHIQWTLSSSAPGLPFSSLLALSPATGKMGLLQLLFSNGALASSRLWTLLRGSLILSVWASGMVLWYNTNLTTVYDTAYTYNVSAGLGSFNASLVEPYLSYLTTNAPTSPHTILPYTYYAAAYTLVLNPLLSAAVVPVACPSPHAGDCMSYLLTGGLEVVSPWVTSEYPDYPMVKVDSAPAVQMDFSGVMEIDRVPFEAADCDIFGDAETKIGIKLCMAEESAGTVRSGLFICNGTQGGTTCGSYKKPLNLTTRLSMYTRRATYVVSRANYSIVSVGQATAPELVTHLDVGTYRAALGWLLNYTAAEVPAPTSIAESFWSSGLQYDGGPLTRGILTRNFQSVLAFPTWLFNVNNWANTALRHHVNDTVPGMPEAFYTTADVVRPVSTYDFDPGMFGLFVGLQGAAIVFIWAVLFWVWFAGGHMPGTSSFPLLDMKYRTQVEGEDFTEDELSHVSGWKVVGRVKGAVVRTKATDEATERFRAR